MCNPAPTPAVAVSSANAERKVSGKEYDADVLAPEDAWIEKVDLEALKEDIRELGKQLAAQQGPEDMAHLRKIISWSRACTLTGLFTMWYMVNPLSIYLISIGTMSRWTIIGHHVCHGGFDKCSSGTYSRFKFGVGSLWRRIVDWLDWMLVEAWNVEHNQLHHYCLGEATDPDLVEDNLKGIRTYKTSFPGEKYIIVAFFMATWKWFYYAPNTFKMLKLHEMRRLDKVPMYEGKPVSERSMRRAWSLDSCYYRGNVYFTKAEIFGRVLGPYFVRQFVLLPLLFGLTFGSGAYFNSLISMVLAEVLTNIHSFIVVVPNHTGDDLYRFDRHCTARSATFFLRQIISSANFSLGTDLIDFHHGWLNYQVIAPLIAPDGLNYQVESTITFGLTGRCLPDCTSDCTGWPLITTLIISQVEHHLWPDLSMLSYQKAAPLVQSI